MATTALDSMPLGQEIPYFELEEVVTQKKISSAILQKTFQKGIVVIFLCRHCPYVKHLLKGIINIAEIFLPQGIGFVGISSNDPTDYPEDNPEGLREMVLANGIPFPILFDETQEVAVAFTASCTPDFFIFDALSQLVYHGRFDGSTPKNGVAVTGEDLKQALQQLLQGIPLCSASPSIGCSIKWKEHHG
jgi:peroxiredoxin